MKTEAFRMIIRLLARMGSFQKFGLMVTEVPKGWPYTPKPGTYGKPNMDRKAEMNSIASNQETTMAGQS